MNIVKKIDYTFAAIGTGGIFTGWTLSQFNEALQTVALVLTIGGLIWRMFKRKKV